MRWQSSKKTLFLGLIVGLVFGLLDLILTWRNPIEDDGPVVLLRFYGPMFLTWSLVSFRAARNTGRPDWQNMMMRYRASGFESLRLFVNLSTMKVTPLKIAAATGLGAAFGALKVPSGG